MGASSSPRTTPQRCDASDLSGIAGHLPWRRRGLMTSVFSRRHSAVLSRRRRPGRQRAAVVGLSAAVLSLLAACSSGGESPGGGGSASTQLSPRQELLAAATQTRQITSATETLTVHDSGASTSTTTELI